jgi:hypothetical protein
MGIPADLIKQAHDQDILWLQTVGSVEVFALHPRLPRRRPAQADRRTAPARPTHPRCPGPPHDVLSDPQGLPPRAHPSYLGDGRKITMTVLRIEHEVSDYAAWKRMFDDDPIDRKGSGVRRYEILQEATDPNYVLIDLEFAGLPEAEAFLTKLQGVWTGPGRDVMRNPKARIVQSTEAQVL